MIWGEFWILEEVVKELKPLFINQITKDGAFSFNSVANEG
jgi:hypothetical protein